MTREEAIVMQKAMRDNLYETGKDYPYRDDMIPLMKESCDIAIKSLEQETVSREVYNNEYALRKEFEIKAYKLQRQLEKAEQCEDVTGHWFVDERPESDRKIICSSCEQPIFKYHKLDFDYRPNYCPNCGAKMREER